MLVKLDKDRYVNTNNIVFLAPKNEVDAGVNWILVLQGANCEISASAAAYLLHVLAEDVDDNFAAELATATPPALHIKSRIAIHLQNRSEGATLEDLQLEFAQTDDEEMVKAATNELLAGGVIRFGPNNTLVHASHAAPSPQW